MVRYNKTLVARLRHYLGEQPNDWNKYLQPLTYGYKNQLHGSTKRAHFNQNISRQPSGPETIYLPKATRDTKDADGLERRATNLRQNLVQCFHAMVLRTDMEITETNERYKKYFDRSTKPQGPLKA